MNLFSFTKISSTLTLLAILLGPGAVHAERKLVPTEAFVKQDQFSNPRLAPDGKHIAINVRVPRNGRMVPTLTVYSLPELKVVSALALPGYEIPLNHRWLTNTRLVISKGREVGLREQPVATGEVIAVDLDGKRFQYLYGRDNFNASTKGDRYGKDRGFGSVQSIPAVRNDHVIVAIYPAGTERSSLYDIDSVTSVRKLVTDIAVKNMAFHSDRDGTPRFATGVDEESLPIVYRREQGGEWKKLGQEVLGKRFAPLAFSADGSEFFAMFSKDGEPDALVRESIKTGQRNVLAKSDLATLSVEWGDKNLEPFATVSRVGIPSARYLDPASESAKLHKSLSQQFPGSMVHFINFTDDGSKLLFGVASDRDPGSYYLYDKTSGSAELLFSTYESIDPALMAERRPFHFKARDGLDLYGYLTLPRDADPAKQKLPMVLIPHGGPFGISEQWFFDHDAQFLANRGFAVLQVNFRGSGSRGKKFEESGYLQWGKKIQDDLADGVKAAINQAGIDPERICTFGISFGGYASMMLPVREPKMFKCAVGFAGAYDLNYKFKEDRLTYNPGTMAFFKRTMGSDEAELDLQSPAKLAAQIKIPVWLVHGGKDKTVTAEHAVRMRDALIKAGRAPEWTVEPDEGHGFYDTQRRKEFYENLETFLNKHIGKPE